VTISLNPFKELVIVIENVIVFHHAVTTIVIFFKMNFHLSSSLLLLSISLHILLEFENVPTLCM